ncbi:MAG: methyltransferase domain-containing protein [Pseudomonadota bacterium]
MTSTRSLPRAKRRSLSRSAGRPSDWGLFVREFVKNPAMVASIAPSSGRLIRRMLAPVDWANTRLFVEYGPGVGTFCNAVLDRLGPDAQYIAIDPNPDFVDHLRHTIRDSRFTVVKGSAADVVQIIAAHGHEKADYILSGLPFTTLPPGVGDQIARETAIALRPGGAFLVYQFRPKVRTIFEPHIPKIDQAIEWWNIPPAQLWWAWKE